MASPSSSFHRNTFINCPFDREYRPLLQALLFVVLDCGLEPRIALERADSGQVRIEKILSLVKASRFSIHDISRIEPAAAGDLPRFNMAFELGLDLGCRGSVPKELPEKQCLILERERYRYQRVLSDLSGNDIRAHQGDPRVLMREVRNWIKVATGNASTDRPGTGSVTTSLSATWGECFATSSVSAKKGSRNWKSPSSSTSPAVGSGRSPMPERD